jgi:hypothetical protein
MHKSPLSSALLACSLAALVAGSAAVFADESANMVDDTTCWRNQAGAIINCSGKGRAGNGSDRAHGERLYRYPGDQGTINTGSGPWVSHPGTKSWAIPAFNKRWGTSSHNPGWSIPPINKRWGTSAHNQ